MKQAYTRNAHTKWDETRRDGNRKKEDVSRKEERAEAGGFIKKLCEQSRLGMSTENTIPHTAQRQRHSRPGG